MQVHELKPGDLFTLNVQPGEVFEKRADVFVNDKIDHTLVKGVATFWPKGKQWCPNNTGESHCNPYANCSVVVATYDRPFEDDEAGYMVIVTGITQSGSKGSGHSKNFAELRAALAYSRSYIEAGQKFEVTLRKIANY